MLRSSSRDALRIALISEHASPLARIGEVDAGGQNVHVAELAAALTRLGHDVIVYTRRDDPGSTERVTTAEGYEVVHVTAGPAERLAKDDLWLHMDAFADALTQHFDANRPDVAHAHFWMSGWATQRAAAAHGVCFLITFHALGAVKRRHQGAADTSPTDRLPVETGLARDADGIIATCRDEVSELRALGAEPSRISTVPCGVDLRLFTPERTSGESSGAGSGRPFRLVSVGRLVPRKGFDTIIEALPRLADAELVIAGGPEVDGLGGDEEAGRLVRLAKGLGVGDRVRFLGAVPHDRLPMLLRSADAVVCTPWYEPFGIVPLEAMACGVPVIASAVGGLLDSVVDGVTGLHVSPRDPVALSRAVQELREPERRRAFGRAARERARQHYAWSQVARRTVQSYRTKIAARDESFLDHVAAGSASIGASGR